MLLVKWSGKEEEELDRELAREAKGMRPPRLVVHTKMRVATFREMRTTRMTTKMDHGRRCNTTNQEVPHANNFNNQKTKHQLNEKATRRKTLPPDLHSQVSLHNHHLCNIGETVLLRPFSHAKRKFWNGNFGPRTPRGQ